MQAAVDSPDALEDARQTASDLADLAQPLLVDVRVWRGIRSIAQTFDAGLNQLAGRADEIVQRFMSTSIFERVARDEFTHPGKQPAILNIAAHAGTAAVWMPPIGNPTMAYQGELLFRPGFNLRILGVDTSDAVPIIEAEVTGL